MSTTEPDVSAVVPVFRVERYIEAAVRSPLNQTDISLEVSVVDDASPDASIARVSAIPDPRIRIISHSRNLGLASARNTGITAARGQYIALLDADDIALPGRLLEQLRALSARPDALMCGSAVQCIDETGQFTGRRWRQPGRGSMLPSMLLFRNSFYVSSLLIRTATARDLLYRPEFDVCEDYDFNVRLCRLGRAVNLRRPLTQYRINPAGLSATKAGAMRQRERAIQVDQLTRLGVQPTDSELRLHSHLGFDPVAPSTDLLHAIDAWLVKLQKMNEASRTNEPADFVIVLELRWLDACAQASKAGVDAASVYLGGKFRRLTPANLARTARMQSRSVLKATL